jgi:Kdo2-lipid IVA lauroyltransferase/acyltransferase
MPRMLAYSFRPSAFARERSYRLDLDGIHCDRAGAKLHVAYADITLVHFHRYRARGTARTNKVLLWDCTLQCRQGQKINLRPVHAVRLGVSEDRSLRYLPFVSELKARVVAANPAAEILVESGRSTKMKRMLASLLGHVLLWTFRIVRPVGPDALAGATGWLASRVGPYTPPHRMAHANLTAAYPEMPSPERERILRGMWDNLGRCTAEYFHLERLWDYEPGKPAGRIEHDQASIVRIVQLRESGRPALIFGGHLANFELLTIAFVTFGLKFADVYQKQSIAPLDRAVFEIRSRLAGPESFIELRHDTAVKLRSALKRGASIGNFVDCHQPGGIDVAFFGRMCKVNPTVARFARKFELPIYGARVVRLPRHRFAWEFVGPIAPPRDASGKIDVAGTMQAITSQIETWVREHPEQWPWLYRRWR